LYGRYEPGRFRIGIGGIFGGGTVAARRALPGSGPVASASHPAAFVAVKLRGVYDLSLGPFTIAPRIALT
ncbi:MAG: hypothetical protein ACREFZ_11090, partial [Acetobacteraceae bacterium]